MKLRWCHASVSIPGLWIIWEKLSADLFLILFQFNQISSSMSYPSSISQRKIQFYSIFIEEEKFFLEPFEILIQFVKSALWRRNERKEIWYMVGVCVWVLNAILPSPSRCKGNGDERKTRERIFIKKFKFNSKMLQWNRGLKKGFWIHQQQHFAL